MRVMKLTEQTKGSLLEKLLQRGTNQFPEQEETVRQILSAVREQGDQALFSYTERFDGAVLDKESIRVTQAEIEAAYEAIDPAFLRVLRRSVENIRAFHARQKRNSWFETNEDGVLLGQRITPIACVGVYVPGGRAALSSSVLMNIVPARVAGVERVIMATPPTKDGGIAPSILVAANEAGADEIYKVGGAQAIAAMAYGTQSVPRVDKIVGPGNIYVALAKKQVYGTVGIDSIAGPSEILILADETANPAYVAADLLSQAEHDELASAILLTTSETLAEQVRIQLEEMKQTLPRHEIVERSLETYGYLFVADSEAEMIAAANEIASEHVELMTAQPYETMAKLKNAGAIFLGPYASEPLGDYFAGPNHILPTNGTAKFFSPLGVDDFIKKSSVISYGKDALAAVYEDVMRFAREEGLEAHARSVGVRFQ